MFTYNLEDDRCGVPASVARKLVHKLGKVPSHADFADDSPLPGLPPLALLRRCSTPTAGLVPARKNSDWLVMEERMSSVGLWSRPSTSHDSMRRVASLPSLQKKFPRKYDPAELERLRRLAEAEADTLLASAQKMRDRADEDMKRKIQDAKAAEAQKARAEREAAKAHEDRMARTLVDRREELRLAELRAAELRAAELRAAKLRASSIGNGTDGSSSLGRDGDWMSCGDEDKGEYGNAGCGDDLWHDRQGLDRDGSGGRGRDGGEFENGDAYGRGYGSGGDAGGYNADGSARRGGRGGTLSQSGEGGGGGGGERGGGGGGGGGGNGYGDGHHGGEGSSSNTAGAGGHAGGPFGDGHGGGASNGSMMGKGNTSGGRGGAFSDGDENQVGSGNLANGRSRGSGSGSLMGAAGGGSPMRGGSSASHAGSLARGSPVVGKGGKGSKGGKGKDGDDEEDDEEAREQARLRALVIDWKALAKALPTGGDDESIKRRKIVFEDWDVNSNGSLSYSEIDRAMKKLMAVLTPGLVGGKGALFEWSRSWKPVIMRAFSHAKEFNSLRKGKGKRNDDYVERDEFRLLLVCIRQFFELFIAFSRIDVNIDRRVDKEEFVASLPELAKWGIHIAPAEAMAEFDKVDTDGSGAITFEEFIRWALENQLDLDDDDDDKAAEYLAEMMESAHDTVFL